MLDGYEKFLRERLHNRQVEYQAKADVLIKQLVSIEARKPTKPIFIEWDKLAPITQEQWKKLLHEQNDSIPKAESKEG
jgi:hypothetical protein